MENLYDLIIVGGGPGGIASAVEASFFGVQKILLIEKGDNHSQTIRQYYKDAKRVDRNWQGQNIEFEGNVEFFDGTKESTLEHFESLLDHDGIDAIFECEVDRVLKEGGNLLCLDTKRYLCRPKCHCSHREDGKTQYTGL